MCDLRVGLNLIDEFQDTIAATSNTNPVKGAQTSQESIRRNGIVFDQIKFC